MRNSKRTRTTDGSKEQMDSYDVRFLGTKKISGDRHTGASVRATSRNCRISASPARQRTARPRNAWLVRAEKSVSGVDPEHVSGGCPVGGEVVFAAEQSAPRQLRGHVPSRGRRPPVAQAAHWHHARRDRGKLGPGPGKDRGRPVFSGLEIILPGLVEITTWRPAPIAAEDRPSRKARGRRWSRARRRS